MILIQQNTADWIRNILAQFVSGLIPKNPSGSRYETGSDLDLVHQLYAKVVSIVFLKARRHKKQTFHQIKCLQNLKGFRIIFRPNFFRRTGRKSFAKSWQHCYHVWFGFSAGTGGRTRSECAAFWWRKRNAASRWRSPAPPPATQTYTPA